MKCFFKKKRINIITTKRYADQQRKEMEEKMKLFSNVKPEVLNQKPNDAGSNKVMESVGNARNNLVSRGEQLERISRTTQKMQDDAQNFASMAKQLREQQERNNKLSSWF